MHVVEVMGADGSKSVLAMVRRTERTVYVCPVACYPSASNGDEASVVGFPSEDVADLDEKGADAAERCH